MERDYEVQPSIAADAYGAAEFGTLGIPLKRILISSAISAAMVILALLVGAYLIASGTSVGPDEAPDNGAVHGLGSLLIAAPFLFLLLTAGTFSVSVVIRSVIGWLRKPK